MVRRVPGAGEHGPGWQVQRWVEGDPIRPLTATRATRRDSTPRNASDPGVRVELAIVQPPVPMRPPYVLAFTLPSCGSGALEMMDVTGRRLARHDFGGLGPGRQSVALDVGRALPPGIYWARLTQGGRIVTARLILIR